MIPGESIVSSLIPPFAVQQAVFHGRLYSYFSMIKTNKSILSKLKAPVCELIIFRL